MNERIRIWDIVLIAALTAVCFLAWFLPKDGGKTAVIRVDGVTVQTADLNVDRIVELEDGTRVIIENRTVWVEQSSCPDHLCEGMGPISAGGEVILCVPNRISVEIRGEEVDALVG